jgi:hypothetical protein
MDDLVHTLTRARTPGAGWGYRAGDRSRVEPTAYALLALAARGHQPPAEAVAWLLTVQRPDGRFGGPDAPDAGWVTAPALLALTRTGGPAEACRRAESWLLEARGEVTPRGTDGLLATDPELVGWPWTVGAFGWVEPTAQAVIALRALGRGHARIDEAVRFLLDRRCTGGGWNYGVVRVRDVTLAPYPFTTALATLALVGTTPPKARAADFDVLRGFADEPLGVFDLAWIAIALDAGGRNPGAAIRRLADAPPGVWHENVHALALATLARALPAGPNPFRAAA